jgi:hypothetical protein
MRNYFFSRKGDGDAGKGQGDEDAAQHEGGPHRMYAFLPVLFFLFFFPFSIFSPRRGQKKTNKTIPAGHGKF